MRGTEAVIAPMSSTDAAGRVTAYMGDSGLVIDLTDAIALLASGRLCSLAWPGPSSAGWLPNTIFAWWKWRRSPEIAILNSVPTAEGAIQVAMENTEITIHNSRCLVMGFGRCGTTLARSLLALGARVTVCSRSAQGSCRRLCPGLRASAHHRAECAPRFRDHL